MGALAHAELGFAQHVRWLVPTGLASTRCDLAPTGRGAITHGAVVPFGGHCGVASQHRHHGPLRAYTVAYRARGHLSLSAVSTVLLMLTPTARAHFGLVGNRPHS